MSQVTRWCARITGSRLFEVLIIVVIGANAIVLGLETYPHLGEWGPLLHGPALLRSLPGVGGFLALALVTLYVYGMAGWLIFGVRYPEEYGTIGRAVLTLFVLLSQENLPELIEQGLAVSPWTLVYYVSYLLITGNLLVNILIAVIVNSMEEVRRLEMTEGLAADYDADGDGKPDELDRIAISQRLDDLRSVIAELERELRVRD